MTKNQFHTKYRKALKAFAERLGLPEGTYEVRSCKGGPAVTGEVILHAESIYMMVCEGFTKPTQHQVLYRSCKGRKDYAGGQNRYMPVEALEASTGLASVRAAMGT